jgi:hypothetical protein
MYRFIKYTIPGFALLYWGALFAGGPLIPEGPTGNTPVTYQNPNITVHAETGTLGSLSNAEANLLMQDAFNLWNQVNTSTVYLDIDPTAIGIDINENNFDSYLPTPPLNPSKLNGQDKLNPIVYDTNGKIIEAFFPDNSDLIVGFAASIYTQGSNYYDEGYAVINGMHNLTETGLKLLITHEIGHFFGLDHSQGNINNLETSNWGVNIPRMCLSSEQWEYPVMYPVICREEHSLHSDDISAVSALYPASNINDNYGILQGRFVDGSTQAILGANIWAINTQNGETYSIVSDYLKQGTGFYKLYLPAGNYTLHANSINTEFTAGGGVGPYSFDILDISFTDPHPITDVTYQGESGASSGETIIIENNQTMNINFDISGNEVIIIVEDNKDDSKNDIFGATSHLTSLLLITLLVTVRRFAPAKKH